LNPLTNSRDIFWIRTDREGNVLMANRAWREHWPLIQHAPSIVAKDEHELIPALDACDFTAPPLDIILTVQCNGVMYRSKWYLSSPDRTEVDVVGMLCRVGTLEDQQRIDQLLFSIHHVIMQPICHVKGLVQLLIRAPEHADQILPKLQQSCDKIEDIIRVLGGEQ
jgi:hypothetical protein